MANENNDHKQLALAAVMFFAPMVQGLVNKNSDFTEKEKQFVQSYIQYGYITIISGVVTLIGVVLYYFLPSVLLYWIHTMSIVITILLLIVGSIGSISGNTVYHSKHEEYKTVSDDKGSIILSFIPGYNIYQRYRQHTFDSPNIWIKESIIRWTGRTCATLITQSTVISGCIFLLMAIRIATLMGGIDLGGTRKALYINTLFTVNPEEMRAYVMASIDFLTQKIKNKMIQPSWKELVQGYKKTYSYLLPVEKNTSIQYGIGAIILGVIVWYTPYTQTTTRIAIVLIVSRYLVMYYKRKHLPALPLAREIQIRGQNIYSTSKKK